MKIIYGMILMLLLDATSLAVADEVAPIANSPPRPVERVITLEHLQTEVALALDIAPVGVADPSGYRHWVSAAADALTGTHSVGTRQEPSLEALAQLEPDFIIGSWWRHRAIVDRLQQIAPTVLYNDLPNPANTNQLKHMRAIVRDLGERTGRTDQARAALATLDAALASAKARISEAGLAGAQVILGQTVPGTTRFRLFTDNSLAVEVAEAIGLENAWEGDPEQHGFETVDIRTLAQLEDGHLLLVSDLEDRVFQRLHGSAVWKALPLVQAGQVHHLPQDTWFFGGPLSAERLAERFTAALLEDNKVSAVSRSMRGQVTHHVSLASR